MTNRVEFEPASLQVDEVDEVDEAGVEGMPVLQTQRSQSMCKALEEFEALKKWLKGMVKRCQERR
jgi:hypothetical protein